MMRGDPNFAEDWPMDEVRQIQPGDGVLVRDVDGVEHPATALGRMERGHRFPIVRVKVDRLDRTGTSDLPWPATDVRLASPPPAW